MISRFTMAAVVMVLLAPIPGLAQEADISVAGGAGRATVGPSRSRRSATGWFAEGRGSYRWIGGYFGTKRYNASQTVHLGVQFIGPIDWVARPIGRFGASTTGRATTTGGAPLGGVMTFGGGVDVGRDFGGTLIIDRGSKNGIGVTAIHFGGYYRFSF